MTFAEVFLHIIKLVVSVGGSLFLTKKIYDKIYKTTLSKLPDWAGLVIILFLWGGIGLIIERILTLLGF